ncbi:hypothetical protein O7606_26335 [Micromonospora sp. WMMD882]|uniref:hypothetical protein n=1 Tax=Micromonospora sp. WMMD882 TaxID=3015151 RepID=UPI00248C0A6E|nr:hypothetical protein [Micromonospora sp. WMMD882]WBB79621.1 hypothetical protein O7606_26335 [Micromonospora sp. WMMD882]
MNDDRGRPPFLAGFWSLVVGGLALVVVISALEPIVQQRDCPNYGGSGNASAFADPAWDLYLPLLAFGWVSAVAVEQILPVTRRHRAWAVRAATALVLVVVGACCLVVSLGTVCR